MDGAMKCSGCGEDFHGAASCMAMLRWSLDQARAEVERLKTQIAAMQPSGRVAENTGSVPEAMLHGNKSRSEQMKAIWAKRRESKGQPEV